MLRAIGIVGLVCLCARVGPSAEPPGPWEQQNAMLGADLIVRANIENANAAPGDLPRPAAFKGRQVVKLKIIEVLRAAKGTRPKDEHLSILLPLSPSETPTVPLDPGTEIIAALVSDDQQAEYRSASPWLHLSFFKAEPAAVEQTKALLQQYPVTKTQARRIAAPELGLPVGQLRAKIFGGKLTGAQFHPTKDNTDPKVTLVWRVYPQGRGREATWVSAKTGEVLLSQ